MQLYQSQPFSQPNTVSLLSLECLLKEGTLNRGKEKRILMMMAMRCFLSLFSVQGFLGEHKENFLCVCNDASMFKHREWNVMFFNVKMY